MPGYGPAMAADSRDWKHRSRHVAYPNLETTMYRSLTPAIRISMMLAVLFLVGAGTAWAKHCHVAHDEETHHVAVRGVVQTIRWADSHVTLEIECEDESGRHIHKLENAAPKLLLRSLGGKKNAIGVGQEVTVEYLPSDHDPSAGILTYVVPNDRFVR
jgi:hypothetical protein